MRVIAGADPTTYHPVVRPTVFRSGPHRFFFFSREEPRLRIHVSSPDGEAKYWIEPDVQLARSWGLSERALATTRALVLENEDVIRDAWHDHFGA